MTTENPLEPTPKVDESTPSLKPKKKGKSATKVIKETTDLTKPIVGIMLTIGLALGVWFIVRHINEYAGEPPFTWRSIGALGSIILDIGILIAITGLAIKVFSKMQRTARWTYFTGGLIQFAAGFVFASLFLAVLPVLSGLLYGLLVFFLVRYVAARAFGKKIALVSPKEYGDFRFYKEFESKPSLKVAMKVRRVVDN